LVSLKKRDLDIRSSAKISTPMGSWRSRGGVKRRIARQPLKSRIAERARGSVDGTLKLGLQIESSGRATTGGGWKLRRRS
jgi:hypothetical protein